jgi:hypothetical protein
MRAHCGNVRMNGPILCQHLRSVISLSRSESIYLALRYWALYYRSASGNTRNLVSKNWHFDAMLRLPDPVTIDGRANITQPQAPVYSFNVISAAVRPFCRPIQECACLPIAQFRSWPAFANLGVTEAQLDLLQ